MALSLVNTDNVDDAESAALQLDGATAVTTAVVGGATYVFVAGISDNGVSAFSLAADGKLASVDDVDDTENASFELDAAISVITASIGGTVYLFVGGSADDGFSMFSVAANGQLTPVDHQTDGGTLLLNGLTTLAIMQSAAKTILYAASAIDNGFTRFDVSGGAITPGPSVSDDSVLEMDQAIASCTASISGTPYLFVAGTADSGVSVFSLNPANGAPTNTDNVTDGGPRNLFNVKALTTGIVAGKTLLFAAGQDSGISVFSVSGQGVLDNIFNVSDNSTLKLANVLGLATATIGGTLYLFAAGSTESGVSAFAVAPDGTLVNVANIGDDATLQLQFASAITTAAVGNTNFLIVTGVQDDGVSTFRIDASGLTINGTAGNDIVNALKTPSGQLLPGSFGDIISGFGGDDVLAGLLGNDTINGGIGNDRLIGGLGKDLLKGQAGRDTFDFNFAAESRGANADTIQGFSHAQSDHIDFRTIDATPGGINSAFLFAGTQSFAAFNATHNGGVVRAVAGVVQVDIGGNGTVDMVIKTPGVTLDATDFFL